jgi:hypothetical protein
MKMISAFETKDGKLFKEEKEAKDHEYFLDKKDLMKELALAYGADPNTNRKRSVGSILRKYETPQETPKEIKPPPVFSMEKIEDWKYILRMNKIPLYELIRTGIPQGRQKCYWEGIGLGSNQMHIDDKDSILEIFFDVLIRKGIIEYTEILETILQITKTQWELER